MTARERRAGFSLLEVAVVLGILAVAAGAAVPAFRRLIAEDDMTVATRRVQTLFQLARDSAVRGGAPVTVHVDSVSGLVWLHVRGVFNPADAAGTSLELPRGVRLELSQARARFTFAPSGAAFADSLLLRGPTATRLVTLDPWTGDVLLH